MSLRTFVARRSVLLAGALLIPALSALSYLLLVRRFGFYNDDWYLAYAGLVEGAGKFFDVFAIDRPFRAYLVGFVYNLFGLHAPYYACLSFIFRLAGAFGFFWLVSLLWPPRRRLAVFLSALFAVYPGWMDQPTGFDYQSHLLSFALMVFSLALTVRAWQEARFLRRAAFTALSVLLQVLSLLLMEYYIGLEGLRLVLLLYLAAAARPFSLFTRSGWPRLRAVLLAWLPYLAGAGGFFVWRVFFFTSGRSATDVSGMFSALLASPVYRGLSVLVYIIQDFFNVTLVAWFLPLYQTAFGLRLRDAVIALALGALAAALVWLAWRWLHPAPSEQTETESPPSDGPAMLCIGSLAVIFSLVPIALGDRHIIFPTYSRFSLPGSVGALILLGGLLLALRRARARLAALMLLAALSVTANFANSVVYANAWESMRNFWWQVSWRAPQIRPETVIAAQYSSAAVIEDYFVWGPANLVYYPGAYRPAGDTRTPLSSVVLTRDNILAIQMGADLPARERRGITSGQDFSRTLVMSMPDAGSCVHVMDGSALERSQKEDLKIQLVAPHSNPDLIDPNAPSHTPPAALFGPEPARTWCYYYQKASLARQRGDWAEVARLGDEAISLGLHPIDWVEWFPFIQAYAYQGDFDAADRLYPILAGIRYLEYQGCQLFTADARGYGRQYPGGQQYLRDKFCR